MTQVIWWVQVGKASGADMSTALVKRSAHRIYLQFWFILFNKTLTEGVFPKSMKVARVVLIFMNGSAQCVENYRSISLFSVFSKLF